MKYLAAVLVAAVLVPGAWAQNAESAIRDGFLAYRDALLAKDGEAAARWVSASTLKTYESHRRLAATMPESELRKQSLFTQIQVLVLRARISAADLRSVSGRALFARAVAEDWAGASGLREAEVGHLHIDGKTAKGDLVAGGRVAAAQLLFVRENGAWKLDLAGASAQMDASLAAAVERSGRDPAAIVMDLAGNMAGRPIEASLWNPPQTPAAP